MSLSLRPAAPASRRVMRARPFGLCPCLDGKKSKFQIFFRHLHGDLNLDEIKNVLRLLPVNGETNLMNLIRL